MGNDCSMTAQAGEESGNLSKHAWILLQPRWHEKTIRCTASMQAVRAERQSEVIQKRLTHSPQRSEPSLCITEATPGCCMYCTRWDDIQPMRKPSNVITTD